MEIAVGILLLMALVFLPVWPHSNGWGYYPSGGVATVMVLVLAGIILGFW